MSSFDNPFEDKTGVDFLFEDNPYVNKILSTTFSSFNNSTNQFEIGSRIIYNYDMPLSTPDNSATVQTLSIFPNPSSDYFLIKGIETTTPVTIYNALGGLVLETKINPGEKTLIDNWTSGVYIVRIGDNSTYKLIIQ